MSKTTRGWSDIEKHVSEPVSEEIIDNPVRNRYETKIDGLTAYLAYTRAPGVITFLHTIVPDELSGKGIASRLVKFALDDARSNGFKVCEQCSFVAAYLRRHPQYEDLLDV